MRVVLGIGLIIVISLFTFFAFEVIDYYPVKKSYTDSLKQVIKANERTIWLLRNDSITHQRCFRIND